MVPSPLSTTVRSLNAPAKKPVTDLPFTGLVQVIVPRPVFLNSGNPRLASRSWTVKMKSIVVVTGTSQTWSSGMVSTMWSWDRSISCAATGRAVTSSTPHASNIDSAARRALPDSFGQDQLKKCIVIPLFDARPRGPGSPGTRIVSNASVKSCPAEGQAGSGGQWMGTHRARRAGWREADRLGRLRDSEHRFAYWAW